MKDVLDKIDGVIISKDRYERLMELEKKLKELEDGKIDGFRLRSVSHHFSSWYADFIVKDPTLEFADELQDSRAKVSAYNMAHKSIPDTRGGRKILEKFEREYKYWYDQYRSRKHWQDK